MMKWLENACKGTVAAAAVITTLPILGPIGGLTAAGAGVSIAVGTGAATVEEIKNSNK